jgi:hypothetical protein
MHDRPLKIFNSEGFRSPGAIRDVPKRAAHSPAARTILEVGCESVSARRDRSRPRRADIQKPRTISAWSLAAQQLHSKMYSQYRSVMKLRELATKETSALVDRLTSAMTAELDATTTRLQTEADAAIEKLREELAAAVASGARAEAGRQQSERGREAEVGRRAALQRELEDARRTIETERAQAAASAADLQADAQRRIDAVTAAAAKQQAAATAQIEAVTAAAAAQQAEAAAQIDALKATAARLQDEAARKIDQLTAAAAAQQSDAAAQIEALKATAARLQDEAVRKIDEITAAAAAGQADANRQIEALKATVAKLQDEAVRKIDEITAAAAKERAQAEETLAAVKAAAATQQADAEARLDAEKAAGARLDAEARERFESAATAAANRQAEAQEKIGALNGERDQLTASLAEAKTRIEAAAAERESLSAELERVEAARDHLARTLREQVLQLASLPMDRLRTGFYRLTTAPSVADALIALVETLGSEFSRAALFQVTGNRLQGVHQVGFDFESDMSKIVVPLTRESPLTEAVRSGRVQGLTANELTASSRSLFGGTPGFVIVLPVAICGEIAAVVYADDSDDPEAEYSTPERRVKFAEVLLWHAVPLLARLSIEENTRAELREYAIQLFTDLERAYAADKTSAPSGDKLRSHLERNLEHARQMFTQQAEAYGRQGSGLFDEQLEALIKSQGTTPFVRDLAAVAHLPVAKAPAKVRKHS